MVKCVAYDSMQFYHVYINIQDIPILGDTEIAHHLKSILHSLCIVTPITFQPTIPNPWQS